MQLIIISRDILNLGSDWKAWNAVDHPALIIIICKISCYTARTLALTSYFLTSVHYPVNLAYLPLMCFISFPDLESRVVIIITYKLNDWHVHLRITCIYLTRLLATFNCNLNQTLTMRLCRLKQWFLWTLCSWTLCSTRILQFANLYNHFVHSNKVGHHMLKALLYSRRKL